MQNQIRTFLFCAFLVLSSTGIFAQDNQVKIGAPFLIIAPDARSAGYGDQGAATSADNNSQFWNPAKYIFSGSSTGASYTFTPWLKNSADDINLHFLSGFYKIGDKQAVSASLRYFSLGTIPFTDISGNKTGEFGANEFALDAAYSRKLSENLSAAVSFRYLRSDLTGNNASTSTYETKAASTFAADIALYYQRKLEVNEVAFGVNISNLGTKISYSDNGEKSFIPSNLRLGARYTFNISELHKLSLLAETSKLLVPTPKYENGVDKNADKTVLEGIFTSFGDAPGGFKEEMKEFVYSLGAEYTYAKTISLRSGYFHEAQSKGNRKYFTFGLGANYKSFIFDIAYLVPTNSGSNNPLDNTLRFSVGFQMGK